MRSEARLAAIIGVAGAMMLFAAGCANTNWPQFRFFSPPAYHHVERTSSRSRTRHEYEHRRASRAKPEKAASNTPAVASTGNSAPDSPQTPPAAAVITPTVTLMTEGVSKNQAAAMLAGANAKLARINSSRLSASSATTFAQASGFVDAGRRAIENQDYLAASGFAKKASLLADKVAKTSHE